MRGEDVGRLRMQRARLHQLLHSLQSWERCDREAEELCLWRALPQLEFHKLPQVMQGPKRQWKLMQMIGPLVELVSAHARQFCKPLHGRDWPPKVQNGRREMLQYFILQWDDHQRWVQLRLPQVFPPGWFSL